MSRFTSCVKVKRHNEIVQTGQRRARICMNSKEDHLIIASSGLQVVFKGKCDAL